jgi:hypothetical protein
MKEAPHGVTTQKTPFFIVTAVKTSNLTWNSKFIIKKQKQTPWPLVRKRTIPTERPPLVGKTQCQLLRIEGCRVVSAADLLRSLISVF